MSVPATATLRRAKPPQRPVVVDADSKSGGMEGGWKRSKQEALKDLEEKTKAAVKENEAAKHEKEVKTKLGMFKTPTPISSEDFIQELQDANPKDLEQEFTKIATECLKLEILESVGIEIVAKFARGEGGAGGGAGGEEEEGGAGGAGDKEEGRAGGGAGDETSMDVDYRASAASFSGALFNKLKDIDLNYGALYAQFIINKIGTVADFDREIPNLVQKVCMLFRGCMIKFKRTVFATKIREAFEKRLAACKEIEQNKQEAENKKRQNDAFRLKK